MVGAGWEGLGWAGEYVIGGAKDWGNAARKIGRLGCRPDCLQECRLYLWQDGGWAAGWSAGWTADWTGDWSSAKAGPECGAAGGLDTIAASGLGLEAGTDVSDLLLHLFFQERATMLVVGCTDAVEGFLRNEGVGRCHPRFPPL